MNKNTTSFSRHEHSQFFNKYLPKNKIPRYEHEDGIDFINVGGNAKTELGKRLSYTHPIELHTVFGKVRSLRVAMDYLITPGYPTELLNKRNLSRADLNSIPKDKIKIPNYWAIVAYLACMRIKCDPELITMIKDNKLPYMAVRRNTIEGYDEQPIYAYENIYQMNRYLAILSAVSELIKHDRFDDENIRRLVNNAKDKPHLNLFHGVAYNLVDAITTEQNKE